MHVRAVIPTFHLYGEDHDWPTPDLLHWESIAQRSRLHDWVIKPHRHGNLLQLILIEKGDTRASLDGRKFDVKAPALLVIPQLTVHGFEFSPDTRGHVLTLAAPLIQRISVMMEGNITLNIQAGVHQVQGNDEAGIQALLGQISEEYLAYREHRDTMLQNLAIQLLVWVVRQQVNHGAGFDRHQARANRRFTEFQQLVELHFREHRPLDFYAGELQISTPHLNSVCRHTTDMSALQVIHERVLLEAKRDLVYTAYSIREISESLGFSEPAYFTRFFKRLQKTTPQEFRRHETS